MALNKQRGNMYSFVTHTWNPLGGKCPHNCVYCYAKRRDLSKYKGDPRLVEKELIDLGNGKVIFVCSMTDLFAEDIPDNLVEKVLEHCCKYPENTYLLQTKNPSRFVEFAIPRRTVLCTTIETDKYTPGIMDDCTAPSPYERYRGMLTAKDGFMNEALYSVTIEPIMKFDHDILVSWMKEIKPEWISIGADSGNSSLPEPTGIEVAELAESLREFTQVVVKSNLGRLVL